MLPLLHNREVFAYELLSDLDVSSFPRPKVYYAERMTTGDKSAIIVMDDLSANAVSLGLSYSVTREQCFAVARHIADLQSYAETRAAEWRGKCDNFFFGDSSKDVFDAWFESTLKCDDASERDDRDDGDDREQRRRRLLQGCERWPSATFAWISLSLALGCRLKARSKVSGDEATARDRRLRLQAASQSRKLQRSCTAMCGLFCASARGHCACVFRTNNMLMRVAADGSITNKIAAIIDYQTLYEGESTIFLFFSSNSIACRKSALRHCALRLHLHRRRSAKRMRAKSYRSLLRSASRKLRQARRESRIFARRGEKTF